MQYEDIIKKIDVVLNKIDDRIKSIEEKKKKHSFTELDKYENTLQKRYEIEKASYYILKYDTEIQRCELFIKRCNDYKEYLAYLQKKDIINIKKHEYNFIRDLQDEVAFFYESKIKLEKQKNYVNKLCGKEENDSEITKLEKDRDSKYKIMTNDFELSIKKLYTLEYLNFDAITVIDMLFIK